MMYRRISMIVLTSACVALGSQLATAGDAVQLFDGKTLEGWMTLDGRPVTTGWKVVQSMIHLNPKEEGTGPIITRKEFGNFKLSFEWKVAPGGNNGLKYRVRNYSGKWYGFEYQILDDNVHSQGASPRHSTGALYDLYEASGRKRIFPAGKFNTSVVVARDNLIEHWLNGKLVVSVKVGSNDWRKRVARSKFSDLHEFGQNRRGRIMLTDHGSEIWFRNLKLKPLP